MRGLASKPTSAHWGKRHNAVSVRFGSAQAEDSGRRPQRETQLLPLGANPHEPHLSDFFAGSDATTDMAQSRI